MEEEPFLQRTNEILDKVFKVGIRAHDVLDMGCGSFHHRTHSEIYRGIDETWIKKNVLEQKLDVLREFVDSPFVGMFGKKWNILSPREKQILEYHIFSGQSGKQTAMTFGIALTTVKNHLHRARNKLGVYGGFGQIRLMLLKNLMVRIVDVLNEIETER